MHSSITNKNINGMKRFVLSFAFIIGLLTSASTLQAQVNMSRYITLTVAKDSAIRLDFWAASAGTPVRIVSGSNTQNITVGTDWYGTATYTAGSTTMTVYGDIIVFDCKNNGARITALDVSNNTQLTALFCNNNNLSSLDLSKNTQLTGLECYENNLNSLDVSKNTQLKWLYCFHNQLRSLDVSGCTKLAVLYCFHNQLNSLDVSRCTHLTQLWCYYNRLSSLDISKNTDLNDLNCSQNNLTSLDVSKNTQLTQLWCYSNLLTSLDVSKNTQLTNLRCYNNKFTTATLDDIYCTLPDRTGKYSGAIYTLRDTSSVAEQSIVEATNAANATDKNWKVRKYNGSDNPDIATTGTYECPELNMNRYITLTVGSGKAIMLDFRAAANATPVRIVSGSTTQDITVGTDWYNDNTQSTFTVTADGTEMKVYGDITGFDCGENFGNLTALDASNNKSLTQLYCFENQLSSLNISKNRALDTLSCSESQLTNLDVSNNTNLKYLDCSDNQLTNLDVSKNTQLTNLSCSDNNLDSLDVSKNTELTNLSCSDNKLRDLDVSKNTKLEWLYCAKNPLDSLDVSRNTRLTDLHCYSNQLSSLDVSNNRLLETLECNSNRLTDLNVLQNKRLTQLYCYSNKLSSLSIKRNTQLEKLYCWDNNFSTQALDDIYCALPNRTGKDNGEIFPLRDTSSAAEVDSVGATTAKNATDKNWKVWKYNQVGGNTDITTTGTYDCSTAVADASAEPQLTLYPNPVADVLYLSATARTIRVYDMYGTEVAHAADTDRVEVSHLPAGIYTVRADGTVAKMVKR